MTSTSVLVGRAAAEGSTEEGTGFEAVRRRGMLGLLSKGGITVVGALAGVVATSSEASAHGYHIACCHLATRTTCRRGCPSNCSFCCPSGSSARSWNCVAGARPIRCGECMRNGSGDGSCWNGSARCSVAIDQNAC